MRIVSWNIQWGRGADGIVRIFRTIEALRALDADIICLQELAVNLPGLPGAVCEDGFAALQAGLPGMHATFGAAVDVRNPDGSRAQFGNAVFSRHPIGQVWHHALPWLADPEVPAMARGCVEAVIETPSGPLRVLSTHLEYYSARVRRAQCAHLAALQAEACTLAAEPPRHREENPAFARRPRPAAAVLCGDFNCEPESEGYACLQTGDPAHAWRDAWRIAQPGQAHAPTVGLHGAEWPSSPFCCDFAWVSAGLAPRVRRVWVEAGTDASDHQPVVLELAD